MTAKDSLQTRVLRMGICWAKALWRHGFLFYLLNRFSSRATPALVMLAVVSLMWRMFANHGGGHRYFCHQAYDCSPWLKVAMALTICSTEIGSLFYWCFLHDVHHSHCDVGNDVHSPYEWGFWNVQLAIYDDDRTAFFKNYVKLDKMRTKYGTDLSFLSPKVTALVFFAEVIFWLALAVPLGLYPLELLLWGNFLPRIVSIHLMLLTNSAAHMFGSRPYTGNNRPPYGDCLATNCWWVALINGGEGWHNNHHAFAKSARHGLVWWEVDTVFMTLCLLARVGVVWDVLVLADEIRLAPRYGPDGAALPVEANNKQNKYSVLFPKDGKKKKI